MEESKYCWTVHPNHFHTQIKRDLFLFVTPRIDFDDRKLFEQITNMFLIFEKYFYDVLGSPKDWI